VVHIDKLKHFNGTPPKAWKLPDESAGGSENSHRAMAGPNIEGQGAFGSPPEVALNSNTDPNVVDGHVQFHTVEGHSPESVTMSGQSAIGDAIANAGNASTPFGRKGRRSRGRKNSVQPMGSAEFGCSDSRAFSAPMGARKSVGDSSSPGGAIRSHGKDAPFSASMDARKLEGDLSSSGCATGSHSSGAKFSAPKGARKFAGDFSSPRGAQKSQGEVRVAGGQHGKRGVTSRFATGKVPQVGGAATPSDKADSRGIETRLGGLDESNASASNVANGRLDNEPLSQMDCAALPSDNVMASQGDDCRVTDHTADLHDDRIVKGAVTPSPVVDSYHCPEGAAPPTTVEFTNSPVPGLSLTDRLASGRSRFDRRSDSVLNDANDANVKFDDFGYLCDMSDDNCTDISANSCDSVAFDSFAHKPDVLDTNVHTGKNASECGIEYCSVALPRDRINLGTAISDEGFSQRPRRELRRPAKYADFSVDFANSQYNRRIRKCTLAESSLSRVQASSVVLTSRGLQSRLPIGPRTCLETLHRQNSDIGESFDDFLQLSCRICGDNLGENGKLVSLDCCDSDSYIFSLGDRIRTLYDDSTVVSPVALDTISELHCTNHSVAEPELLMARTKQTAKNSSEQRQPGVSKAVKEWTCFVCGWTTEWPRNLKRHLARIHTLREDGTVASPSYRDTYANKRSVKWQEEHAVAESKDCEHNTDVESCAPPVPKKPKVKSVRKVGQVDKKGLMGVEATHTIPLSGKINLVDKDANFSASDALKAKGGLDPMLAQVVVPAHSATLNLPATDAEAHVYDNIEMLLNDELRMQEDAAAVQSLFDVGLSDPTFFDLGVTHDISDIPLGLGWRCDTPMIMFDDICDGTRPVVAQADRTTKASAKIDPVIAKALTKKSARGACTPQRIVSSILTTLIDDVVHSSPVALVGSILEDLVVKAVPRPLPENKKDVKTKEKKVDPGTKSGSAHTEVLSRAKNNGKTDKKAATQNTVASEKNNKESLPLSKLSCTDGQRVAMATIKDTVSSKNDGKTEYVPVPVSFTKGKRVAHVPTSVAGEDPTLRKPCAPKNPAPKPRVESHVAGSVGAMSTSVPAAKSAHVDTTRVNVSNANASARRKIATQYSKNADTKSAKSNVANARESVTQIIDNVAHGNTNVSMNVDKTPIKVAQTVKTSAMRADPSFLAPVAILRVVGSPPVASRKYLPRSIVAKYAWKLDQSTAAVAALLKSTYGLSSPEESRMLDRVSDMRCAFKYMTARMRQQSSIAMVTETERLALYNKLEEQLKFVEMYDDEDDA